MSYNGERLIGSLQRLLHSDGSGSLTARRDYENHIVLLTEIVCDLCVELEQAREQISKLKQEVIKPESVQR